MTTTATVSESARVHAELGYPVIDGDGHCPQESIPDIADYVRELAGSKLADGLVSLIFEGDPDARESSDFVGFTNPTWRGLSQEAQRDRREYKPPWGRPRRNAIDDETTKDEQLFYDRMDEFGIDFAVIYPSLALSFVHIDDEELRRASCRALNIYNAARFRQFSDRLTPVAAIPMHSPEEAIDELEHVVNVLGLKAIQIAGFVARPIPGLTREYPELKRYLQWIDTFGIDSAHDYDPVWAKCTELGVSPTQHSSATHRVWGSHRSISNYQYNQVNCFTDVNHALCKSLFMGGVTRRFPDLKFGFLEGGTGWACQLYADMCGRWSKRRPDVLQLPKDRDAGVSQLTDEWAACEISQPEDIKDLFVPNFYFGCEADDPMNAVAFSGFNPYGAQLKAFMGSDLGHWDVPDMSAVIAEAYELVEHGHLDDEQLRDFLFVNPARFFGESNPSFFAGTSVQTKVEKLLT